MGQTLTHGVYLPDEGERNCYAGLAANWQILDSSVGTIAEHTTQIAGKAPAVHTHTKADITDFPVYGNAAGTICEGNDSRLSDARTPVAHTHTKSDVTDLFNSANTWSALNTYTTAPKIHGYSTIINAYIEQGTIPQSVQYNGIWFGDKNSNLIGSLDYSYGTTGSTSFEIRLARNNANANRELLFSMVLPQSGNGNIILAGNVTPKVNNSYDLGSSSYQWNNLYAKKVNTQSLNGINPGALSLPNYSDTTYIDISGSIVPPSGQTTINYSGGENQYTPPVDGWLSIRCDGATFLQIYRNAYNCPGTTASRQDASGKLVVTLPVLKNNTYTIKINTSGTTNLFQLYPCLGNV